MTRLWIALATALWGGLTMSALTAPAGPDFGLIPPAAIGAALAGALFAPLFAKSLVYWPMVAAALATTLGASLAGALVGFPTDIAPGLILAPIMVWTGMVESPLVALVWLAGAFAVSGLAYSLK